MRNPASGGARECHSGRSDALEYTAPHHSPQQPWRVRALIRSLSDAARSGSLAPWDCEFVASITRQAALRRWRPSPKQEAILHRISASLAEPDEALIDADDPLTAADLFGGRHD